ncbi:LysR family transcriptional regulator [Pseudooceanicola aestuarii]|uniref:LysR family transcriptional regulator n=1 Tax=Pseudooceanicola aestuarii TaxID=2697319 RepID=UPI0013D3F142|nr:LysR family transcriptional regulator [Pseudooceanicola aestuarii]
MTHPSASFDWNQARAFLATAETGSLSAAARLLGQTQPTLGRQITALEEKLGVTLFDRVGRTLVLTPSGQALLPHLRAMEEAATRMALTATGQAQAVKGHVSISASDVLSALVLPPILARLSRIAPEVEVTVLAQNTLADIPRREADIAVRHVRPTQPELTARLVGEGVGRLYGATRYLDRTGRPAVAADLARHAYVAFTNTDETLHYMHQRGLPLTRENIRLTTDNGLTLWEMVKHGLGLAVMTEDVARITPEVEAVLPEVTFAYPVWLVTHRELHTSRRIRIVFDHLADALSAHMAAGG